MAQSIRSIISRGPVGGFYRFRIDERSFLEIDAHLVDILPADLQSGFVLSEIAKARDARAEHS